MITVSLAYDLIVSSFLPLSPIRSHSRLWYCNVPLKIKCFVWICIENCINTWDNLKKRDGLGPIHVSSTKILKNLSTTSLLSAPLHELLSTSCTGSIAAPWYGMVLVYWILLKAGSKGINLSSIFPYFTFGICGSLGIYSYLKIKDQI